MKARLYYANEQDTVKLTFRLKRLMKRAVKEVLKQEDFPYAAEVSVSFVDDETIHDRNRAYRNVDKPTDVLSFPLTNGKPEAEDVLDGSVMLGDIVISGDTARRQAAEYGHSIEREVCFLTVHSMLHLLGYDHEQSAEHETYMNDSCERILAGMKLYRNTAK